MIQGPSYLDRLHKFYCLNIGTEHDNYVVTVAVLLSDYYHFNFTYPAVDKVIKINSLYHLQTICVLQIMTSEFIVTYAEISHDEQFLLLSQCFLKLFMYQSTVLKVFF